MGAFEGHRTSRQGDPAALRGKVCPERGDRRSQNQSKRPPTTTDAGIPVASQEHSLTVGPDGPILLQDFYLIEQMANFNRERIPERQPHAKGGGAFGTFVVTGDVSRLHQGGASSSPVVETEVLIRFSTVAGERGSPDTWRDPAGFAVKFYTSEGNFDIVGNNTPVFFIRDPMKFQNFIRSQKRLAANNLRDPDMQWDFWTLSPESAHQVTWLMGDRGIPRGWRHMNGYSSHTYMWVNGAGERFWVKYHFKSDQGIEFLTQAEATGSPARTGTTTTATSTTPSSAASSPAGRSTCRSCRSTRPTRTGSTPSTSPRCGRTRTTRSSRWARMTLEPQRDRLPHRNRAGGVPAQQHGAGDGPVARQDAARPWASRTRTPTGPAWA